jgi:hypothetical protein
VTSHVSPSLSTSGHLQKLSPWRTLEKMVGTGSYRSQIEVFDVELRLTGVGSPAHQPGTACSCISWACAPSLMVVANKGICRLARADVIAPLEARSFVADLGLAVAVDRLRLVLINEISLDRFQQRRLLAFDRKQVASLPGSPAPRHPSQRSR